MIAQTTIYTFLLLMYLLLQVVTAKFAGVLSASAKERAWQEIAGQVSSVSGVVRDVDEIKKKWICLKSQAKMIAATGKRERQVTGGGPKVETEMTASQLKIIGMMGEECISGIMGGVDTATQPIKSAIHPESSVAASGQLIASAIHPESSVAAPGQLIASALHPESAIRSTKRSRENEIDLLVSLQEETLSAVSSLVLLQSEMVQLKKSKLELQKQKLELKRVELAFKGISQNEDGTWIFNPVVSSNEC